MVIDYLHGELHSGCSSNSGSVTTVIVILHFYMYICIYVSLCNPMDTGCRLDVHKAFRTLTFKLTSRVLGAIFIFFVTSWPRLAMYLRLHFIDVFLIVFLFSTTNKWNKKNEDIFEDIHSLYNIYYIHKPC